MSSTSNAAVSTNASYTPGRTSAEVRQALLADGFACILEGRPFPPHLAAPRVAIPRPATCEEGIARILRVQL